MNDHEGRSYSGNLTMLFEPDELAAYEYRRTGERRTFLEPEKRLIFAVLEDAIMYFQRFINTTSRKERQLHQDAAAWIFKPDDHRTFSFEFICDICGLNPEFLRMGLRKWSERNGSKSACCKAMARISRRGAQRSRLRY
jgi:hypothetical protein